MIFALNGSRDFGEQVCRELGSELSAHEEREFEDGEHKARPLTSVRARDVFVIHSLYADERQSGNDKLCRLLFFIGALKDAAAARVTAIVPYLAYTRKDRRTKPRDPITTRYVAALFEAVGTDVVVTMDVHNLAAYENAFRCRTEHIEATKLMVAHFAPLVQERNVVVVSPDAGGIKRAEQFRQRLASVLDRPVAAAFAEKHRSEGVISGDLLMGDVDGRDAIIVDDLISSGTTLIRAAHTCSEHGAARVMAAATHGLFMADAATALAAPVLQSVVIADTVPPARVPPGALRDKLTMLRSAPLFADVIQRLHEGGSLLELMES